MENYTIPKSLRDMESFSRKEYSLAMQHEYGLNESRSKYVLQKELDRGTIIRKGWNQYTTMKTKTVYLHDYSDEAKDIAALIENNFVDVEYQIFEMMQLNQFMNHLVAHNTIFIGVENDLTDYVFDALNKEFPGRVMLKPSLEMYYRYLQDNEIVVGRLPSETPKGIVQPWQARIEKILVDVMTDKLISGIIPEGEKAAIIEGAYKDYFVDEGTMIRYARRKGAVKKVKNALHEYGRDIKI